MNESRSGTASTQESGGAITLRQMYTAPFIYGTAPSSVKWSPDNAQLAFLWNSEGGLKRDVYISRPGEPLARLTDAASVGALPVEDDKRTEDEIRNAELMDSGVTEFDWAPDGAWIAFLCRGDLYRVPASGGEAVRLTQSSRGKSALVVSPDGRRIAFQMDSNVWAFDVETGGLHQLTFFGAECVGLRHFVFSPDSQQVAVIVEDTSMYEKVKMPDYTPEKEVSIKELRRGLVGKPLARLRVGFVPSSGGKMSVIPISLPDEKEEKAGTGVCIAVHAIRWTWDSSRLLLAYTSKAYTDLHLCVFTPGSDQPPVEIYQEVQEPWFRHTGLEVSPDSQYVYFGSYRDGWRHVYRLPVAGGETQQMTQGEYDVEWFHIPKRASRIFYTSGRPHPQVLSVFAADLDGRNEVTVSRESGWHEAAISEDGSRAALTFSQVMVPPEVYRLDDLGFTEKAVRLTTSPRPEFAKIVPPKVERFQFVNKSDGAVVHGKLILPHHFNPAKRYPAVLTCVYAGLGKEGFGRYHLLDTYMANELGYVLAGVDLRASAGYGRDFFYGYHKRLGIIDAEECVSCAEYLRTLPYIDGERIGIWGGSYGGFLTLMVMCGHPGVFHTGVSWKPVTDWHNYWDGYTAPRLGRPDEAPDAYQATSPLSYADRLQGNLLLIHGMQDDNVLFQDAVWMVQKFVDAGKHFDLMVYPKDDHGLTLRRESLPDCMERIAAYFEEHMGRGPTD